MQTAPPELKQWIAHYPPDGQRMLSEHAFNQIDRVALHRFRQTHQPASPIERSFENGLAVVIPCYNHACYLGATVACLINQTYRPYHAIFVEDHSTDESWTRLQGLVAEFPDDIRVTLLRTDRNRGQAAAINLGIERRPLRSIPFSTMTTI